MDKKKNNIKYFSYLSKDYYCNKAFLLGVYSILIKQNIQDKILIIEPTFYRWLLLSYFLNTLNINHLGLRTGVTNPKFVILNKLTYPILYKFFQNNSCLNFNLVPPKLKYIDNILVFKKNIFSQKTNLVKCFISLNIIFQLNLIASNSKIQKTITFKNLINNSEILYNFEKCFKSILTRFQNIYFVFFCSLIKYIDYITQSSELAKFNKNLLNQKCFSFNHIFPKQPLKQKNAKKNKKNYPYNKKILTSKNNFLVHFNFNFFKKVYKKVTFHKFYLKKIFLFKKNLKFKTNKFIIVSNYLFKKKLMQKKQTKQFNNKLLKVHLYYPTKINFLKSKKHYENKTKSVIKAVRSRSIRFTKEQFTFIIQNDPWPIHENKLSTSIPYILFSKKKINFQKNLKFNSFNLFKKIKLPFLQKIRIKTFKNLRTPPRYLQKIYFKKNRKTAASYVQQNQHKGLKNKFKPVKRVRFKGRFKKLNINNKLTHISKGLKPTRLKNMFNTNLKNFFIVSIKNLLYKHKTFASIFQNWLNYSNCIQYPVVCKKWSIINYYSIAY